MATPATLPDRILDATEAMLRRHGVEKTNVVDVARVLKMSHGNIYRHFPNKKAMLNAVALRWLDALTGPLEVLVADKKVSAPDRLVSWFNAVRRAKSRKFLDDPEIFRVHYNIVQADHDTVRAHVEVMLGQVERMIRDGIAAGEFPHALDASVAARAFLHATSAFHHPALVMLNPSPPDADAHAVVHMALAGLRAGLL